MSEFQYKDIDPEGWQTLEAIAEADRFNEWMYKTIRPFCNGRILEIGSGIGNISKYFVDAGADITLSDIRPVYCEVLKKNFPGKDIVQLDLVHPSFETEYAQYIGTYDSAFALNVVEHIEKDSLAIRNCFKLLKSNGHLVILVPAYPALYNRFDRELEHFRRYTRKQLNGLLATENFTIKHSQYFNFMGIPGWYVSGKLQKNKTIPKSQMSFYNKLVPIFKLVDKCVFNRVGLSVISVGVKK
ncbi:MAG: class I SAM-dependent methyltransferase [Chitinophagaceae bacterium]|nr:class I SAM-dependent methyltransferase [Chitinophagaceae bacterium]